MRFRSICRMFAIAVFATAVHAAAACAAWSHDPATSGVNVAPNPQGDFISSGAPIPDGAGGVFVPFSRPQGGGTDIVVQHLGPGGTAVGGWSAAGVTVATGAGTRSNSRVVVDGSGGVLVFWEDSRSGTHSDIYGQHLNAAGVRQWAVNGALLNSADAVNRTQLSACTDATGGAFLVYRYDLSVSDEDIYGVHVNGAGAFTTSTVAAPSGLQLSPVVVPDNLGGAFFAYEDRQGLSGTGYEIKLAHMNNTLAFTVYGQTVDGGSPANQYFPVMISDGSTGVYVAWLDDRVPITYSIFANHIDITGGTHLGWSADGLPMHSSSAWSDVLLALCLDNSGGLFAVLEGYDTVSPSTSYGIVAHRTALGYPVYDYGANGQIVSSSVYSNYSGAVADGSGGVIALFDDVRSGVHEPYVTHLTNAGAYGPAQVYGGRPVAFQQNYNRCLVSDPNGGAFVLWNDYRTGYSQTYVAHVDRYGLLGDSAPTSAGVKDIPADQGGHVRLSWNASWMDNDPDWGVSAYWIWRQAPLTLASSVVRAGAGAWSDALPASDLAAAARARSEGASATRIFQRDAAAASAYAWELLAQQPTNGSARYSYVASTTTDSIGGHNPYTVYMVEAHSALDTRAFWQTAPDSGYSVDNLPPLTPAPFTATRATGTTNLLWGANSDADLAGYRLYRGTSVDFVPSSATLLAASTSTSFADVTGAAYVYKLTAIDVHGNESPVAIAQPTGTLAVGDALPRELAFTLASPNPARAGAAMRFALPAATHVRIALFDAAGREVRELANGDFAPGTFTRAWDGAITSGAAAPSGLYFARFTASGRTLTTRFVLTR